MSVCNVRTSHGVGRVNVPRRAQRYRNVVAIDIDIVGIVKLLSIPDIDLLVEFAVVVLQRTQFPLSVLCSSRQAVFKTTLKFQRTSPHGRSSLIVNYTA